jgi:predicted nuclease of predicted toxin-antitoxin system
LRTNGSSVTQVRTQDVLPTAIGDIVLRAIRTAELQLLAGALVTVDSFHHRVRLLPI